MKPRKVHQYFWLRDWVSHVDKNAVVVCNGLEDREFILKIVRECLVGDSSVAIVQVGAKIPNLGYSCVMIDASLEAGAHSWYMQEIVPMMLPGYTADIMPV